MMDDFSNVVLAQRDEINQLTDEIRRLNTALDMRSIPEILQLLHDEIARLAAALADAERRGWEKGWGAGLRRAASEIGAMQLRQIERFTEFKADDFASEQHMQRESSALAHGAFVLKVCVDTLQRHADHVEAMEPDNG